jgi:PAS domain S-box-containing protein
MDRKHEMEGIGTSEEKFTSIFENAPVGIFRAAANLLVAANPAMARMFGYGSPAEMITSRRSIESYFVHPEQRNSIVSEAMKTGAYVQHKVDYRRQDGSTFMGNLRVRVYCRAADEVRISEGFIEDVNEREQTEAELHQVEEQLRQSQKMGAIGQLAGGIAHDFNNTLLMILMRLGKLREMPLLSLDTMESLKEIERTTARATNLTRQLLSFSRKLSARIERLDINSLISELLVMLRPLLGDRIEIAFQCPADHVWVNADAGMMEQVVMNLCINARDAMPKGGRLTLAAARVEVHSAARAGCFVCLSVSDTGCGMDETVLARVFEPFFTTKEVGKGTGLGMATVCRIVKEHQGWVNVESAVGRGSSFRVYLPSAMPMGQSAISNLDEVIRGGSEGILLVEDDLYVRRLVATQLRELGYAVLEAGNGLEALHRWEEHQQDIELLFTDMTMPGNMSGLDLALRLKKEQPSLRVISSSGSGANLSQNPLTAGQEFFYLPKPYEPAALALTVRRCLDKPMASAAQTRP